MKIRRNEKGITLVALIITIVVLLILAVVSISSIQEDGGLIGKANGAVTKWNDAQKDEQIMMNSYLDYLNAGNGGSGTSCSHVWENTWCYNTPNICTICGFECTHTETTDQYGPGDINCHWITTICDVCRGITTETAYGNVPCTNDGTGKCKYCKQTLQ